MMELVLVVCLQLAPERCEEMSIGLYPYVSQLACLRQSPPEIATWSATHPGLRVTRWTCRGVSERSMRA